MSSDNFQVLSQPKVGDLVGITSYENQTTNTVVLALILAVMPQLELDKVDVKLLVQHTWRDKPGSVTTASWSTKPTATILLIARRTSKAT